jgi:drug/metabolite transporter (DMT)-like permease
MSSAPPHTVDSREQNRGYILLVGITLFWGLAWPAFKLALNEIPPWTYRSISVTCGGLGLLALCRLRGMSLAVPRGQFWLLALVSMFMVTGWQVCSAYGVSLMEAGRASILGYTMPLWATILSRFVLGEKFTAARLAGLALGMSGLLVLIWPDLGAIGDAPLGVAFMLAAAISWGLGTVLLKRFTWTMPMLVLTAWQLTLGSLPVIAGALLSGSDYSVVADASWTAIMALVYTVVLPLWFCHWAYFTVVGIFPASKAAISVLIIPFIGLFSSAWLLGEPVGWRELAAMGLVIAALALVLLSKQKS